jgi:hypothetical protein
MAKKTIRVSDKSGVEIPEEAGPSSASPFAMPARA